MFLQLEQQSVLIGRRPSGFTEHYYTEWDDGLGREKVALFILMSIHSTQVPGAEIGKEAFQLLQDHFLDDLKGDPYDRFEYALREINQIISEKEAELDLKFVPNFHVVCGVIQGDSLFLSQRGDAQGYLLRKRHLSSVTDGLYDPKNKEDLFQNIASGILDVNDVLLLSTGPLVQYLAPGDLSRMFFDQSLPEAAAELRSILHPDIEDQMALLAFEVLEKVHAPAFRGVVNTEEAVEEAVRESVHVKVPEPTPEPELENVFEDENESVKPAKSVRDRLKIPSLGKLPNFKNDKLDEYLARIRDMAKLSSFGVKQRFGVFVAIFAFSLFSVVIFGLSSSQKKVLEDLEAKLAFAEDNIIQAETTGAFDKGSANTLLEEAQEAALEVLESGKLGSKASAILDEIEVQRGFLDNVVYVDEELRKIADMSSVFGVEPIVALLSYDGKNFVISESMISELTLDEIGTPVKFSDGVSVVSAAYFADQNIIVLLDENGDVLEYADGNAQFADTSDVSWKQGVDFAAYSNKIYVLGGSVAADKGQIWRYQRGSSAYGSSQAYVSDEGFDLSDAVSIAVDGNVWVLRSDGSISKFFSGASEDFSINKAPMTSLAGSSQIYTELDITDLYVLDPVNQRILVYNKSEKTGDLTYDFQYVFDKLDSKLVDLFLDKDRNVLIFATEKSVYELDFNF